MDWPTAFASAVSDVSGVALIVAVLYFAFRVFD
jgi:hypothetical protein